MLAIKYCGTGQDYSGYGDANRMDVMSLFQAGLNITIEGIRQVGEKADYGLPEKIWCGLLDRDIDYKIKIIHLTPDLYPMYSEDGKYNIGRLFWECDRLPPQWIKPCNQIQEIWTASEEMAKMITESGVKTPIHWFPQPIETLSEKIIPFTTQYPKDFTFYSIFQWINRKNPRTLLRAYWKEFEGDDKVTLLLKTYRVTYNTSEYDLVKADIEKWKNELKLKHFPKIYLVEKLLTRKGIQKLHEMGDCFIQPSSGEGWSRPTQEAMLHGKPVISGNNGGLTDLMTPYYYYKVESKLVPVQAQPFIPWYLPPMQWKELDEDSLREQMRAVYNEYPRAIITANKAKDFVKDNFSIDKVGKLMLNRIEEINSLV